MEKQVDLYLNLDKEVFDETMKEAEVNAKDTYGENEPKSYLYDELEINPTSEFYFDEKKMAFVVSGEVFKKSKELGYVSLNIPITIDIVGEIIDYYRNVLGKIKSVLKATK